MKKNFLHLITLLITSLLHAQCTIDISNTTFFSPSPDSLPCVERNLAYDHTIQVKVPTNIDLADFGSPIPFVLVVDSIVFSDVTGFPNGLSYSSNPSNGILYGGQNGCVRVEGTTTDPVGNYPLSLTGFISLHGFPFPPYFDGDTTLDLSTLQGLSDMFSLYLDVINTGEPCRTSGVKDFSAQLNASIALFPNPSDGFVNLFINGAHHLQGKISVIDATGRVVLARDFDATGQAEYLLDLRPFHKGVYNIVLSTGQGSISKTISLH